MNHLTKRHSMSHSMKSSAAGHIFIWFLGIVILIGGGVFGYWYLHPQEAPAVVRNHLPDSVHQLPPIYKWQDDQGRWQVSDQPPQDRPYETVVYRRDMNVMPAGR